MSTKNLDLSRDWPPSEHAWLLIVTPKSTLVEAQRTVIEMLELVDTPEASIRYRHSMYLQFDGFAPARPPECVQEARSYLRTVHATWPWWTHFLKPDPDVYRTLLLALAPLSRPTRDGPWITDRGAARRQVMRMLRATRALHDSFGWPRATSDAIIRPSWAALKDAL
jgi:hypothetical protein